MRSTRGGADNVHAVVQRDGDGRRGDRLLGHDGRASGCSRSWCCRFPFLRSIGYAGMLIPIVSVLVSITLLPVILATIGPWIDRPRSAPSADASRFWTRWSTGVVRRRWWAARSRSLILARARGRRRSASRSATRARSRWRRAATRAQGLDALTGSGIGSGALDRVPHRGPRPGRARGRGRDKLAAVYGVRGAAVGWRATARRSSSPLPEARRTRAAGRALYSAPEGRGAHGARHDRRRPGRAGRRLRLGRLRQLPADDRADRRADVHPARARVPLDPAAAEGGRAEPDLGRRRVRRAACSSGRTATGSHAIFGASRPPGRSRSGSR